MKHLIAFLGHTQLRIQNPVYRQFVQTPLSQRNASLLFMAHTLEERELTHEVEELQRREGTGPCELTFHLCASLDHPNIGQQIVQTSVLIRRIYDCPTFVYCLMPNIKRANQQTVSTVWRNLAAISNGVSEYPNLAIITHCFLYQDAGMQSLAILLDNISKQPEVFDYISRYGYMGKLVSRHVRSGDEAYVPEFPPIFATFNAKGVTYADSDIRFSLHSSYLHSLLSLSRPQRNAIGMERCNEHVEAIFSDLPLTATQTSLCGETFLNLDDVAAWPTAESYWQASAQEAVKELADHPRDQWINQMRGIMNVRYVSRYRSKGVNHYYQIEKSRTADYCHILLSVIDRKVQQVMLANPYPPETALDILRSAINRMQQLALLFERQHQEAEEQLKAAERRTDELSDQWDSMGMFDRMRGKDKLLFDEFTQAITQYYLIRTRKHGASFATKLLNELIPQVVQLGERWSAIGNICQQAYQNICEYIDNNNLAELLDPVFPVEPLQDATIAIQSDSDNLHADYMQLVGLLTSADRPVDGQDLVKHLRMTLSDKIDHYINSRIESGTMSAVMNVSIIDRLEALFADRGGIKAYIDELKQETTLTLPLKDKSRRSSQYLLIAPDCEGIGPHVTSSDSSSLQMLHIKSGLSLADLDGFSGQRMFVEPSIF